MRERKERSCPIGCCIPVPCPVDPAGRDWAGRDLSGGRDQAGLHLGSQELGGPHGEGGGLSPQPSPSPQALSCGRSPPALNSVPGVPPPPHPSTPAKSPAPRPPPGTRIRQKACGTPWPGPSPGCRLVGSCRAHRQAVQSGRRSSHATGAGSSERPLVPGPPVGGESRSLR